MSAVVVQQILEQINQLSEADRLLLEQRLAELADAEWRSAAADARKAARAKSLNQTAIDRAIEQIRRPA